MNLDQLHYLLKKYNLTPNKVRGQNFLVSDDVLDKIIQSAELSKKDCIMEVGPGLGSLTTRLLPEVEKVIAFEVDENFAEPLAQMQSVNNNLEIIWQDILSLSEKQWLDILGGAKKYKIVANIPYYLTSKFVQKFLSFENLPQIMTLMIQKEVAERIVNKDEKKSMLSLAVDFYAQSKIIDVVSKDNFYPAPKVDSVILYIFDIRGWIYDVDEKKTWQLIHRGFANKRKKLFNNILSDPKIEKEKLLEIFDDLSIDQNIRAEKLSKNQWIELSKRLII